MEQMPEEDAELSDYPEEQTETGSVDDGINYVWCDGKCPGCKDCSFYEPHDRYADKKRDKEEFRDFQRKIPPIGATYEEFDERSSLKPLPCRGPDNVSNGPCTCEQEIAYRAKNKQQNQSFFGYLQYREELKPYGFLKKDIPTDTFAPGLRVDVGDMIDLLSKREEIYEVRLCDGSERTGRIRADAIHVIEEPTNANCCKTRKNQNSNEGK